MAGGVEIQNFKVSVDGKTQYGSADISSHSNVIITMVIQNTFSNDDDIRLKTVNAEVVINDIDQGSDIDKEFDEFSLDPQEKKTLTLSFTVPYAIDEDTYPMRITVDTDDDEGDSHSAEETYDFVVKKEDHKVVVSNFTITPNPRCGESSTLSLELTNTGKENENNVKLDVENEFLNYKFSKTSIDLDSGQDSSQYSDDFTIAIPKDMQGNYPVEVTLSYNDGDNVEKTFLPFAISCGSQQATPPSPHPSTNQPPQQTSSEPVKPSEQEPLPQDVQPVDILPLPPIENETIAPSSFEMSSLFSRVDDTTLLVVFAELLIVFIVVFVVVLLRSSKR